MKTVVINNSNGLEPSGNLNQPSNNSFKELIKKQGQPKWKLSQPTNTRRERASNTISSAEKITENIHLEVTEVHTIRDNCKEKALLLTIYENQKEKNCFLISIRQLLSEISSLYSGKGIEHQKDDTNNFENLFHSLSLREQQVLSEVSHGKTSNEIGRKFFISTNTVKNHRKNIKKKLNFSSHVLYSRFLKWTVDYCQRPTDR